MGDIRAAGAILYLMENNVPKIPDPALVAPRRVGSGKGHADEGESEIETAIAQIYEETGFRRSTIRPGFREVLSYKVDRKKRRLVKDVIFFLCEMPSDEVEISRRAHRSALATLAEIETMVSHEDLKHIFRPRGCVS